MLQDVPHTIAASTFAGNIKPSFVVSPVRGLTCLAQHVLKVPYVGLEERKVHCHADRLVPSLTEAHDDEAVTAVVDEGSDRKILAAVRRNDDLFHGSESPKCTATLTASTDSANRTTTGGHG